MTETGGPGDVVADVLLRFAAHDLPHGHQSRAKLGGRPAFSHVACQTFWVKVCQAAPMPNDLAVLRVDDQRCQSLADDGWTVTARSWAAQLDVTPTNIKAWKAALTRLPRPKPTAP